MVSIVVYLVQDTLPHLIIATFAFYVTQTAADTKPGCVLRPANVVSQLQKERNLLSEEQVLACKNGFNTWAFVGDINNKPQLSCVFQSDDAQNEFLSNPKVGLGEDVYDAGATSGRSATSGTSDSGGTGASNKRITGANAQKRVTVPSTITKTTDVLNN